MGSQSLTGKVGEFLNKDAPVIQQRADFFHELAHIVRHEGDQDDMPELFMDLQEVQAANFRLIASRLHEEYHTYREDVELMKSKFQMAVSLFRSSQPKQPSNDSRRLLRQLRS
jgi:Zn-dependent peptidase ImmA (M78 family)